MSGNSGQFNPGTSGNPAGRPVGSKGKWTEFKLLMEPHVPAVVEMLVEEAVEMKNMAAAKMILERVFPADVVKLEDTLARMDEIQEQLDRLEAER